MNLLRRTAGLLAALLCAVAVAQTPAARSDIRAVIEAQLAAFQADDAELAFSFASPEIQARFGTPQRFMSMVRAGYDPVYRPSAVEFQELHPDEGAQWVQQVLLVDRDGQAVFAFYPMKQQPDGSWRIGGCTLLPAPARSL